MGQTRSEPVTNKETFLTQNNKFVVGSSSMQGWRVCMEDALTVILSIPEDRSTAYFAIFDGHGGSNISSYASRHLHKYIFEQFSCFEGDVKSSIEEAFHQLDEDMRNERQLRGDNVGSTAVIILLRDDCLYCANAGDSRAVAFVNNQVVPLSCDHKPNNPGERSRITAAGAQIDVNRINGNLALSRALGDFAYKQNTNKDWKDQAVTSFPDVVEKDVNDDWEFIVMACDGIWDVLSSEEVCSFVHQRILQGMKPDTICEALLTRCLAPDGQMGGIGSDNMTVIIIVFLKHAPEGYIEGLDESTVSETSYHLPKNDPRPCVSHNEICCGSSISSTPSSAYMLHS